MAQRWTDQSSRGGLPSVVCPVSVIAKPRRGKPWPGMRSNRQGRGALVQKPHKVKKEETGTDSLWGLRF